VAVKIIANVAEFDSLQSPTSLMVSLSNHAHGIDLNSSYRLKPWLERDKLLNLNFPSPLTQIRYRSRYIGVVDQLEAAVAAILAGLAIRGIFGVVRKGPGCFC
jgi:hypothetical protein